MKATVPAPKYGWEDVTRNSIGIIHSLEEDGDMGVAFCFRSKPFCCSVTDMEKVQPFEVGQEIHVIPSVSQPRLGWSNETAATIGKISRIDMDGTLNVSKVFFLMVVPFFFFNFYIYPFSLHFHQSVFPICWDRPCEIYLSTCSHQSHIIIVNHPFS